MIREFLSKLSKTRQSELETYWIDLLDRPGIQGAPSLEEARKEFFKSINQITRHSI